MPSNTKDAKGKASATTSSTSEETSAPPAKRARRGAATSAAVSAAADNNSDLTSIDNALLDAPTVKVDAHDTSSSTAATAGARDSESTATSKKSAGATTNIGDSTGTGANETAARQDTIPEYANVLHQQQRILPNSQQTGSYTNPDSTSSILDSGNDIKPVPNSEEWHRVRRDNHKEVERRRREAINRGINELAKIVPDCDKHKGLILSRTVDYIKKLKENEQHNIEKLTLEKLLTEQAIAELSASNKTLKVELAQAWKEVEHWKRACGVTDDSTSGANAAKGASS